MVERGRIVDAIGDRVSAALLQWSQGHRREAYTTLQLAHRELNAWSPRQGENGETPGFDLLSGLYLAEMSDEMGEYVEAENLYRRLIHPPHPELESFELRPDILLSYSELCTRLGKTREAAWAFTKIAKGDRFQTYLRAAEDATAWGRLSVAEPWVRKALEIRPDDATAKDLLIRLLDVKASGRKSEIG